MSLIATLQTYIDRKHVLDPVNYPGTTLSAATDFIGELSEETPDAGSMYSGKVTFTPIDEKYTWEAKFKIGTDLLQHFKGALGQEAAFDVNLFSAWELRNCKAAFSGIVMSAAIVFGIPQPSYTLPDMSWTDTGGGAFAYEIATDNGFGSVVHSDTTPGISLNVGELVEWAPDTYYFRVKNTEANTAWSDVVSFTIAQTTVLVFDDSNNDKTVHITGAGTGTILWGDGNFTAASGSWDHTHVYASGTEFTAVIVGSLTALAVDMFGAGNLTGVTRLASSLTAISFIGTQLAAIDLSNNAALLTLSVANNELTALDVSACTLLTSLDCGGNDIGDIDLSANTDLVNLTVTSCGLATLGLATNILLQQLLCSDNDLAVLVLTTNTALVGLACDRNNLTALDISHNTALENLSCTENALATLNASANILLNSMDCRINALDVSAVNGILTDLLAAGLSAGYVALEEQSPAAPPSGAGITAAADLTTAGWTVTTD